MDNQLYGYSPIVNRPPLKWPNAARIAFYIGYNIEHFQVDRPSTSLFGGTATLVPDPLNFGWRDYGVRVGVWRMMETLDRYKMRASVLPIRRFANTTRRLSMRVAKRKWAWLSRPRQFDFHTGLALEDERRVLREIVEILSRATGQSPKGWLGPALTETSKLQNCCANWA